MKVVCPYLCCLVLISLPFAQSRAGESTPSLSWANPVDELAECEPTLADAPHNLPYTATDPSRVLGDGPQAAPHYPWLSRNFSLFRSPASYGMEYWERCPSTPWTPRGTGVARRTSEYRMDYRPYVLRSSHSTHGPAFYPRIELPPCCGLDCGACHSCFWCWFQH